MASVSFPGLVAVGVSSPPQSAAVLGLLCYGWSMTLMAPSSFFWKIS